MNEQLSLNDLPLLPYAGTSGWSGSEASHNRAKDEDGNGTTVSRQQIARAFVFDSFTHGTTWKELADHMDWHHGQASGVLSVLHKSGHIVRLMEQRNKCHVYVASLWVQGREESISKSKTCKHCGGKP